MPPRYHFPVIACLLLFFCCSKLSAMPVEELDPNREWRVKDIHISGDEKLAASDLMEILQTKTRPWYFPWRPRPLFDPGVFATDLERLKQFYQDKGYYEASVTYDLDVEPQENLVTVKLQIAEGRPIRVSELSIDIVDAPELEAELKDLTPGLALHEGNIFAVEAYHKTETQLKEFFYDKGRARVEIRRQAQVLLEPHEARVTYTLRAGPETAFGATTLEGLKKIDPAVVSKELSYKPGTRFSGTDLRLTEQNLRELDLFSEIRIEIQPSPGDPAVVPVKIHLEEKPPRDITVGIGYGTEDQLRGQVRWRNNNWLGGARRLEVGIKASFIARELTVSFLQPHFLGANNRLLVNFGPQQLDEPGYFLNATRLQPRFERKFTDRLTGFLAYRLEYDHVNEVSSATALALAPFERNGWLSGWSLGLLWNRANDPLNPTSGWVLSFLGQQAGGFLGGRFDFFTLLGEAKGYYPLAENTVFASRLKIGFATPLHGGEEVPIFERLYAGGSNSVRGYGRSRLGPLSASNDPLGGRSLIEGSFELRQRLTQTLGGALFIDFGQVSLQSFDPPIGDLQFSAGFGIRYTTPVGPLRFDVGFPFHRPDNDRPWQIHFSIGQSF